MMENSKRKWFLAFGVLLMLGIFSKGGSSWSALADEPVVPAGSETSTTTTQTTQPATGMGSMLIPFALMFAVVYFLMIRPQQKKTREQQHLLSSLKHGDEVLTASGILGKIAGITDKIVTLEIADQVRVKMLKSQISQVIKGQVKELT